MKDLLISSGLGIDRQLCLTKRDFKECKIFVRFEDEVNDLRKPA